MITWMKTIEKLILAGNLGKSIVKDTDGKDEFYWHESTVKLASGDIIPAWVLKDHSDPSGESFGTIFRFGNDWIWEYWLGVLPPQNWKTVDGVDFFQCPEYMIDDITLHCAGYKNRYFSAYRRVWTGYDVLAKEIKQLFGEEQL